MILLLDKLFDVADLVIKKGIPILLVLKVLLLSVPFMLAITIPMAILVASISVYGEMSQDFELIGYASCGISLTRLMRVPFIFSILLFFFTVYFNGFFVPESNHRLKNLLFDLYQWKPTIQLKEGLFNELSNYRIYIAKINDKSGEIRDIKIHEKTKTGTRIILARKGKLESEKDKALIIILQDGTIQETGGTREEILRKLSFSEYKIKIPVEKEDVRKIRLTRSDREMTLTHLLSETKKLKEKLKKEKPKWTSIQIKRYEIEFHKKFAIPFASVVFVLLGIPLAKRFGKGGYGTAFGVSLFIFAFYYVALVGGEEASDQGKLSPFLSMWSANFITFILSIVLLHKYR